MDWLSRNPLAALLAAVAVLLAVVIAAEATLGGGHFATPGEPKQAAPAEARLLPPLPVASPESYPETGSRPLFIATRRPAPEAPSAAQNSFQKGQFILQGVIVVGDNRVAMLREKSSGKIHRVEQGRDVNGIKVAQITPEEVTLTLGADREVLPLLVGKGGAAQHQPVPVQPMGGLFLPNEPAPAQPNPNPVPAAAPVPGQPFVPPTPLPPGTANPIGRAPVAGDGGAALTPEELLARRRARRGQPGSPQ